MAPVLRGNMLDKDGNVPNMERAMLADAIATTTGAICGTSTVTTFVESSAGIAEGGRTGLTSLVTAALFFVAMFLSPVAALVPSCATAAALIYVGVLMMHCVKDIDWTNAAVAVPAFLTIAMMPFAYNISYGISFGIFSYILISLFTGKAKEIKVGTWVIGILFAAMFLAHPLIYRQQKMRLPLQPHFSYLFWGYSAHQPPSTMMGSPVV